MRTSKWVVALYSLVVLIGIIIALPNFFTQKQLDALPSWLPKRQVTLGLDLRGGSYLVLEVDAAALKKDRLRTLLDDARSKLRADRIQPQSIRVVGDAVVVTIPDADQRAKAETALRTLISQVNTSGFGTAINDIDVTENDNNQIRLTLTEAGFNYRLDSALQQSLEIIRQRVDQVGVAEPSIQRVGSDRIVVQLPGLQDPAQLRQLLGSTAKMSFHMVADANPNDPPPPGVTIMPDSKIPPSNIRSRIRSHFPASASPMRARASTRAPMSLSFRSVSTASVHASSRISPPRTSTAPSPSFSTARC